MAMRGSRSRNCTPTAGAGRSVQKPSCDEGYTRSCAAITILPARGSSFFGGPVHGRGKTPVIIHRLGSAANLGVSGFWSAEPAASLPPEPFQRLDATFPQAYNNSLLLSF